MADLVGRTLGKYRIESRLGRGGMAEVYKAYQPALSRYVAIKVLHSHLIDDADFIGRFEREALAIASLRHPNIVQVYDFDREGELYFMVMEFIDGPTLKNEIRERVQSGTPFTLEEIISILVALCNAVDYAHSQGMVHRDLKPANVMITPQGQVVLTDFGIARILGSNQLTMTGALTGTPAYMSPEQGQGERGDERSDIYALGVILYELTTETVPFDADTPFAIIMKHINEPRPLPTSINPAIPSSVEEVVLKAMSKNPAERFQSAAEMAQALQAAAGDDGADRALLKPVASPAPVKQPIAPAPSTPAHNTGAAIPFPRVGDAPTMVASGTAAKSLASARGKLLPKLALDLGGPLLIAGALLILIWRWLGNQDIVVPTARISAWLTGNWPWLVLAGGLVMVAVGQRHLLSQVVATLGKRPSPGRRSGKQKFNRAEIQEQTLPGVTLITTQPSSQQATSAHETIIFHREMEAVITSANDHLIEDWLRMQDSEQISGILSSQENARLLITGFGSFGGTSLVRGVTAKLMDNFARRQQGKVLVIRLETLRDAPEGHYRLFVNENQAGTVNHTVTDPQLTPLVQTALTGQANTFNPQADDNHNTFQGLTMVFDQETTGVDEAARSRAIAGLVYRLLNLLTTGQEDEAIQQAMHELHATQPANKSTQTILIIDRIDQAAAMQRLLNSALVNPFYASWLSVIVVSRREAFNRWPVEVQQQVTRRGFRQRYIRRLWEQDLNLKRELRRLMLLESSVGDVEYQRRQSLWLAHLTYEARGSIALALRKLKTSHDWFEKEGRLHIDPSAPYVRDRESIDHNAFVQKILDQHWPDIIGSLFNSPETADQARIGVYYLIDWMQQHPIFDQAKLAAAAAASEIPIADEPEIRAEVLPNLLRVLTREHYLDYLGHGKYRLAWQERVTFLHKVWRQFREGGGRKLKPNGAARAQGTAPEEISAPIATPPPPASTPPPGVDDTPVKVEEKGPELAPLAGPRSLRLALLCDMTAQENDTASLVTQIAFEIVEAGHRLVILDHLGTETLIRQKFAPYWPLYAENVDGVSRPFILITTNDDAQGDEYEQVIPTANIIKALLDKAEAIILAQQDEATDSVFSPENIQSRAQAEDIPVIPVGAAGGAAAALWAEVSNKLSERYQGQISSEDFTQINLTPTYIPDIARAVVAVAEKVCP